MKMVTRTLKDPPYVEILFVCECGYEKWVSGYRMSATCDKCGQYMDMKERESNHRQERTQV